jgi:hypothetical protein
VHAFLLLSNAHRYCAVPVPWFGVCWCLPRFVICFEHLPTGTLSFVGVPASNVKQANAVNGVAVIGTDSAKTPLVSDGLCVIFWLMQLVQSISNFLEVEHVNMCLCMSVLAVSSMLCFCYSVETVYSGLRTPDHVHPMPCTICLALCMYLRLIWPASTLCTVSLQCSSALPAGLSPPFMVADKWRFKD